MGILGAGLGDLPCSQAQEALWDPRPHVGFHPGLAMSQGHGSWEPGQCMASGQSVGVATGCF